MDEVGPRPAMVLCAPVTHPYGSNSCHDADCLQATRLSGKHDFACTDTEVLVLAFLLVGFGDNSLDPTTWANAVRAAAGDFERGQRWMVPDVLRSTARGSLRAEFERFLGAEIVAERMKAVLSAVNNFDGAGRSAAPLTSGVRSHPDLPARHSPTGERQGRRLAGCIAGWRRRSARRNAAPDLRDADRRAALGRQVPAAAAHVRCLARRSARRQHGRDGLVENARLGTQGATRARRARGGVSTSECTIAMRTT